MSFDARSLERLKALGRQLPQPLPRPDPPAATAKRPVQAHPVERETDPDQLFRELMQASADGTVPPHLLERLRELEQGRERTAPARGTVVQQPLAGPKAQPQPPASGARRGSGPSRGRKGASRAAVSPEEQSLYEAFDDLLHLQADEPDPAPAPTRESRLLPPIELQPKPTQRRGREGR